jgi:hypothetical protein
LNDADLAVFFRGRDSTRDSLACGSRSGEVSLGSVSSTTTSGTDERDDVVYML